MEAMSATNENKEKEHAGTTNESDDDFKYEEVPLEDEWSLTEGEENLAMTLKAIQTRAEANATSNAHRPQAVDDFLRNFLLQMGMTETLERFQTEWSEMAQRGLAGEGRVGAVPDVYADNRRLDSELRNARRERGEYRSAASAAAETLARLQKARDFHKLQHKRVVQERDKLIEEIKKLKAQCDRYEPAVKRMNEKYHAVLKQTVWLTMERDKAIGRVNCHSTHHNTV